jgi:hypothetical protein
MLGALALSQLLKLITLTPNEITRLLITLMDAYEFVFKLSLSPFYPKDSLKTNSYAYISVISSQVILCGVRVTGFNN